jgi:hypothetical protein
VEGVNVTRQVALPGADWHAGGPKFPAVGEEPNVTAPMGGGPPLGSVSVAVHSVGLLSGTVEGEQLTVSVVGSTAVTDVVPLLGWKLPVPSYDALTV